MSHYLATAAFRLDIFYISFTYTNYGHLITSSFFIVTDISYLQETNLTFKDGKTFFQTLRLIPCAIYTKSVG